MDIKFSVVIPTRNRPRELRRAVNSLEHQTYDAFETVIVDNGEEDVPSSLLPDVLVESKAHGNKVVARNEGMAAATGDWICWLDDDDEYSSRYLEVVAHHIEQNPEYKCFNFGAVVQSYRPKGGHYWTRQRQTFKPKMLDVGHESFRSGQIGSGSFVFHKDVWRAVGDLPEAGDPYTFSFEMVKRFPELGKFYPNGKELGNPWGDDYAYFYMITRQFHSFPIDMCLYIQNVRGE